MNSNPQMRAMAESSPEVRAMLQNPEAMRQMMNPETMQAMVNMQRVCDSNAPVYLHWCGANTQPILMTIAGPKFKKRSVPCT